MAKGNPNPSPETRWKKGQSGNPGGKAPGQRAAEIEAARIAANLRLKTLSTLQDKMDKRKHITDDDLMLLLNPGTLKLFKDSEDRAHGTPTQDVNHRSDDGSMTPQAPSDVSGAVVSALVDKLTD